MRDPNRIPRVLELLEKAWKEAPDWRLGQLVYNVSECTGWYDVYCMEDDDFEKGVKELMDRWKEQENTTY